LIDYAYALRYLIYINKRVMAKKDKSSKPKEKRDEKQTDDLLHKQWHHVPVVLVGLMGILVVIGAVYGLITVNQGSDEELQDPVTLDSTYEGLEYSYAESDAAPGLSYSDQADQLAYYGDYDKAQALLQEGVENAASSEAQAEFYKKKTFISLNSGQFEDALSFALSAEGLSKATESAALVAEAAEALNDDELAIEYWILAAERTPEDQRQADSFGGEYGYFLFRIQELGGEYEG
jgi:tetratricopeptide (TPR) repeat protein